MQKLLKEELVRIKLSEKESSKLKKSTSEIVEKLKRALKNVNAQIFIGGSLAKGTIIRKEVPDVDIFIRFYYIRDISKLPNIIRKARLKAVKIHGSRDYFQIKEKNVIYEIVPVLRIAKPEDAVNVTDLSYFHVNYVIDAINKNPKLADDIILAKSFTHASECYGAESYIKGFSGYALELLVINYGGFIELVKAISKTKSKLILDPGKKYKNKIDILNNLNESKLGSPIVFIDPTFAERNALAALSDESFSKFREYCTAFLKKPSKKFFEQTKIDKKKYNLIVKAVTDRQEGDVAGSKLIKFYKFLLSNLGIYFEVKDAIFYYNEKKHAEYYFDLKAKKELIMEGPPIKMEESVKKFKEAHKKTFVKNGKICSREKININYKKFLAEFKKKYKIQMNEMGITRVS
ncbi:MAG: hypothetical protein ABIH72_00695 [archaeon]